MSKLTSGPLLIIGVPVVYVTSVLFDAIPFVSRLEAYGDCSLVENFENTGIPITSESPGVCWDAVRHVMDPLGLSIAIFFAALFIAGLVLIGLHIYQHKLLRKMEKVPNSSSCA